MTYSALKVEATCASETSVVFHWTTWRYISKDKNCSVFKVVHREWQHDVRCFSNWLVLGTAGLYQLFMSYMHVFRVINPPVSLKLRITCDSCVIIFSFLLILVVSEVWVVFFSKILSEGCNLRRHCIPLLKFLTSLRSCDIWVNCL
jgi:hypothetical protein